MSELTWHHCLGNQKVVDSLSPFGAKTGRNDVAHRETQGQQERKWPGQVRHAEVFTRMGQTHHADSINSKTAAKHQEDETSATL
jgi:hypothetical protein